MGSSLRLLTLFTGVVLLLSCSEEQPVEENSAGMASISLSFPTSRGSGNPDKTLEELRVIIFRSTELGVGLGAPVTNKIVYPVPPDDDEIEITEIVPVGHLNIYLIGNEAVEMNLNAVATFGDLESIIIDNSLATHNYLNSPFPMYSGFRAVRVDALGNVTHPDVTVVGGKTTFLVERAISRLDVRLSCKFDDLGGKAISIDSAVVLSMPLKPNLVAHEYNGANFFSTNNSGASLDVSGYLSTTRADGLPGFESVDFFTFYLPEHLLNHVDHSHFTYLKLVGTLLPPNSPATLTYRIPLGNGLGIGANTVGYLLDNYSTVPETDLSVTRNTHYDLTLHIKGLGERSDIEVSAKVQPWDEVNIPSPFPAPFLNVSTVSTLVNGFVSQRIYFWTNQKEQIYVEPVGKVGDALSGPDFGVNDIYLTVAGAPVSGVYPSNFSFDPNTGQGYFDLVANPLAGDLNLERYLIYVRAGQLHREIEIYTSYWAPVAAWDLTPWVGTFHRAGEVGERFIYSGHSGAWSAEVEDPFGTGLFINLGSGGELGSNSGLSVWERYREMMRTHTPSDPESVSHYVLGNLKMVSGMGNIAFRVGMTCPYTPTSTAPARYGRIKVTWNNGGTPTTSYIYVRQGEDPDYLMRPEDTGGGVPSSWGADLPRPDAVKISPYNLTASDSEWLAYPGGALANHPQLTPQGGSFTKYPTQAGAYFEWANTVTPRIAYHPVNPVGSIPGWNYQSTPEFWNPTAEAVHETCPPGYRRLRDGYTATAHNPIGGITDSELRQSLWWLPQEGMGYNYDCTLWGFYADGFFDRRVIQSPPGGNAAPSAVSVTTHEVAYIGKLYYNPNNHASLFFPAAGLRTSSIGASLMNLGLAGTYYTSSTNSFVSGTNASVWTLWVMNSHDYSNNGGRFAPISIRCVVEVNEWI